MSEDKRKYLGLTEDTKFHCEFWVHDGLLQIFDRDISYWNPENGPNREDKFQAVWCYGDNFYLYGSMPSIPEKFETTKTKAQWLELIELINIVEISKGELESLAKAKGE